MSRKSTVIAFVAILLLSTGTVLLQAGGSRVEMEASWITPQRSPVSAETEGTADAAATGAVTEEATPDLEITEESTPDFEVTEEATMEATDDNDDDDDGNGRGRGRGRGGDDDDDDGEDNSGSGSGNSGRD